MEDGRTLIASGHSPDAGASKIYASVEEARIVCPSYCMASRVSGAAVCMPGRMFLASSERS